MRRYQFFPTILLALVAIFIPCAVFAEGDSASAEGAAQGQTARWRSFITAEMLHERMADQELAIVDVRDAEAYARGHIPGAINLPGELWRTPQAKPGEGDSQYIFRKEDGSPDVERYEEFLGEAGIGEEKPVVIYGNYAGKSDGSVPVMILHWLGHKDVAFLDGVGLDQWRDAGFAVSTEPRSLPPTEFEAEPIEGFVWNLSDVTSRLGDRTVMFCDTRHEEEYTGRDMRDNRRGGHIPGAILLPYEDLLNEDVTALDPNLVRELLEERGFTPDKKIVLYCQTATRVSLPYLMMRDLGYDNVFVYDGSWHEYGNREDTPIE